MLTAEEKFQKYQDVAAMLDEIGPQLEQINRGAAEFAYKAARRIRAKADRQAMVLTREEMERLIDDDF